MTDPFCSYFSSVLAKLRILLYFYFLNQSHLAGPVHRGVNASKEHALPSVSSGKSLTFYTKGMTQHDLEF